MTDLLQGEGGQQVCVQCEANARYNEAGGYPELAAECRAYCLRGHVPLSPTQEQRKPVFWSLDARGADAIAWHLEQGKDNGGISREALALALRGYAEAFRQGQIIEDELKAACDKS